MAIIDRTCIFFEGPLTGVVTGDPVALTALTLPGRMEPMPLRISVTEAFEPAEVATLALALEEAASADAADWAAVPGAAWTVPGDALNLGARLGPRFLPQGVRESFLRLTLTPVPKEGTTIGKGRIFAALMREDDLPWEPALQKK
ncbi:MULTISPECIES: hypothetical protein [unclassified Desulfovibrio]|uniref:hypothetical protein n=1 Tax=unclassified Desulfovibrio TaxID=2593640 RepID=UPI0013EDEE7C|nr:MULTISPECIES: hypothetical protein [unclassified Desulfovibrio]